jgi:surfactin synthase thioesterase subunit
MGAMIAFELAHYRQQLGRPLPARLFTPHTRRRTAHARRTASG